MHNAGPGACWADFGMRSAFRVPHSALRRAYTLFELILVLALLVVLSALAYPSLESMYGDFRLTSAADQVRARWAAARAQAMDEGRPYRFAIVPNKGNFRVAPDSGDYWPGNGDASANADTGNQPLVVEEALPKGVRFALDRSQTAGDAQGESSLPVGGVEGGAWTNAVTFLPDGTTREDREYVLITRGARPLLVKLRGLTGAVTVQPLAPEERR